MQYSDEKGLTGLEILILLAIAAFSGYLIYEDLIIPAGEPKEGLVTAAVAESAGAMMVDGAVFGFADTTGPVMNVELLCNEPPESGRLGLVRVSIRLVEWESRGVDISVADLRISTPGTVDGPPFTSERPLPKPAWTIAERSYQQPMIPGDSDNILEPGEIFDILIRPKEVLAPDTPFTVTIENEGSLPLLVSRKVPPAVQTVMNLG